MIVAASGLLAVGGFIGLYFWAAKDLPGFKKITDYNPPLVTTVYARDNRILGYFYREKRFLVRLEDMPPHLAKAFLAAEDSAFYEHEGIDLTPSPGLHQEHPGGSIVQGGSTITSRSSSACCSPRRKATSASSRRVFSPTGWNGI